MVALVKIGFVLAGARREMSHSHAEASERGAELAGSRSISSDVLERMLVDWTIQDD